MSPTAPASTKSPPVAAPHQALYRRWRAQTFSEIVGQTAVVETLRNAVRSDRVSHAVLFVGPRGTGKTSLARILAKALNCTNLQDGDPCDTCEACTAIREGRALDLIEIDAASNRGIGDIRELRDRIHYAPTDLRRKVYILDEAHQITKDAWNALLKSLEEPPDFVVFMFASTHPQDFPPAILSRLQRYDVRRLTIDEIEGKLSRILAAESVTAEPGALRLIARLAAGGMRDAESILDQVLASAVAGGSIDEPMVRDLLGLAEADAIERLTRALVSGDAAAGIAVLAELDDRGRDVAVVLDQIVDQVRIELADAVGPTGDPATATALAAVAHRLAGIDPERRGVGGLRFQIELALLDPGPRRSVAARIEPQPVVSSAPRPQPARPEEAPRPEPKVSTAATAPTPDPGSTPDVPSAASATARSTSSPPRGRRAAVPLEATATEAAPPAAAVPVMADPSPKDAPATAATTGGASIDDLRAAWPEIVAILSQNPPIKPLILPCRPVSIDGPIVTLGFPEDQAFLRDALERRRSILEDGIGRVLGRSVSVRCVATNLEDVPAVPLGDAADLISEARRIFADDLADVGEVS